MKDRKNKRRKQKTGRFDFTTFRSPVLRQFSNAGCFDYAQQSCIAHRSCAEIDNRWFDKLTDPALS